MVSRRPCIVGPSGALIFSPSEAADQTTTYTSPLIKLPTSMGPRYITFQLDGSDNVTITESDLGQAGQVLTAKSMGAGTILNAVNVPVGSQLVFRVPPTNLSGKVTGPNTVTSQKGTQHGSDGRDCFVFVNGTSGSNTGMGGSTSATGSSQPDRAEAGTSLEVGEGVGAQLGN